MFKKVLCSVVCYSALLNHSIYSCTSSCNDGSFSMQFPSFIDWNALNSEIMVYLPNPDVPSIKVPMTSSFAYSKALELLKSGIDSKIRIGTDFMIRLFKENYGPAIELFDNVCDIRGDTVTKSTDTLEKILGQYFSHKQKRLGGWEEEDEY